jgi:hypothetical protein
MGIGLDPYQSLVTHSCRQTAKLHLLSANAVCSVSATIFSLLPYHGLLCRLIAQWHSLETFFNTSVPYQGRCECFWLCHFGIKLDQAQSHTQRSKARFEHVLAIANIMLWGTGQGGSETEKSLKGLEKPDKAVIRRLGRLETFEKTATKNIADLRKFQEETSTGQGNFDKFEKEQFTPWKTETDKRLLELEKKEACHAWKSDTDKRLGELEKKHGDCAAWKDKVNGQIGALEKNKLSISDYRADKDTARARFENLESFKSGFLNLYDQDQTKHGARFDDLEKRVKGLEDKTTATNTKINDGLKEVTERIIKAEKRSEEGSKSVTVALEKLSKKVQTIQTTMTRSVSTNEEHITTTGQPGQLNNHSPRGINVRVHNGRDILVNGSGEASQAQTLTLSQLALPTPAPSQAAQLSPGIPIFSNTGSIPSYLLRTLYPPLTPPPTPPPSNAHDLPYRYHRDVPGRGDAREAREIHNHIHLHSSRRHRRSYNETDEAGGSYNMQQMPAIQLGFSRTTPKGLFSTGKTDNYEISLGGGRGEIGSGSRKRGVKFLESR